MALRTVFTGTEIYTILKNDILTLKLLPGTALSETEVAAKFNVSRSPVHSSFARLQTDGLINIQPQKKTKVSFLDWDYIKQLSYMRLQVESAVFRDLIASWNGEYSERIETNLKKQAETAIDDSDIRDFYFYGNEYHEIIFSMIGKKKLWSTVFAEMYENVRFRYLQYQTREMRESAVREHNALYQFILQRDYPSILQLLAVHFPTKGEKYPEDLPKYKDYFI